MRLQKITAADIDAVLRQKDGSFIKICCYEYSSQYLKEMCEAGYAMDYIDRIVDANARSQGNHSVMGADVEVCGEDYLEEVDFGEVLLVITSDYYKEAYEKLSLNRRLNAVIDTVYYFSNRETEYEEEYRERYKDTLLEDMILFRSGPHASAYVKGMDFADNARALFEYMLNNHYNEKYRLVWLVKDPDAFRQYEDVKNVEFIAYDWSLAEDKEKRSRYYHALCLSKYIFFTDAYGFARNSRGDQIRVQLWHGCGFKTRVNFVRCEKRYEYTTVISDIYSKIHQDIYGLREDQMLVTGYAKEDWLFHPAEDFWRKLEIPQAHKYIFWLPTFRMASEGLHNLNEFELSDQTGLPIINSHEELVQLGGLLRERDAVLILKLHPFQDREKIGRIDAGNIVILDNDLLAEYDIHINQLLGYADALISDYSSAAVDYMLLDRPIGFTLDDVEEYAQSRGFVFENIKEWLPGKEIFTFDDFCSFISEMADDVDSSEKKRRELRDKMHLYHDDQSCRRIAEALKILI